MPCLIHALLLEGGGSAVNSATLTLFTYYVDYVLGCSSPHILQPPPPPTLVDKTPTPPTSSSNSAPRLHGYAGLLSKIKPLNPLFTVLREEHPLLLYRRSLPSRDQVHGLKKRLPLTKGLLKTISPDLRNTQQKRI